MYTGLDKTEGYPRANNSENAPPKATTVTAARAECAQWLSVACVPDSILPKMPLMTSFTRNDNGRQFPLPARAVLTAPLLCNGGIVRLCVLDRRYAGTAKR